MADTTTPQQAIYDLAPYPGPGEGSPDAMARYFTVQGFASYCRLFSHPCWQVPQERDENGRPSGAYAAGLRQLIRDQQLAWAQYVAATLLRDKAGEVAEMSLVDALRRSEDSAELASETLGDWLNLYGIDAETIVQAVRAEREARDGS